MATGNVSECPNCGSQMSKKEAPFHYHGTYIGNFEAYVCGVCHHVYFTENAMEEIMNVPTKLEDFGQFIEQEIKIEIRNENSPKVINTTSRDKKTGNALEGSQSYTYATTEVEVD